MSPVRRTTAAAPPPPPPEGELLDIFNLSSYAGGKTIPEGDYAVEFIAQEYQSINQSGQAVGKPRVGVMLVCYPRAGGDPIEQFVSLGTKAILSWVPTSTGKGFAKRAGGPGLPPTNKSNWVLLLDSMVQCGLPVETLKGNDFTALDGVWMHIKPMPEPEERKSFRTQAATGEAGGEDEVRGNGLIPICTEILQGGAPWEGGGGFDTSAPAPTTAAKPIARRAPAAAPVAAAPAAPARRGPVAVAATPAIEEAGDDEESLEAAAQGCIADVLLKDEFKHGLKRMRLRMETHGVANQKYDEVTATEILKTFFSDEKALANILGTIGYVLKGSGPQQEVVPAA